MASGDKNIETKIPEYTDERMCLLDRGGVATEF